VCDALFLWSHPLLPTHTNSLDEDDLLAVHGVRIELGTVFVGPCVRIASGLDVKPSSILAPFGHQIVRALDLLGRRGVVTFPAVNFPVALVELGAPVRIDEEPQRLASDQAGVDEGLEAGADGLGAETLALPVVVQVVESFANGLLEGDQVAGSSRGDEFEHARRHLVVSNHLGRRRWLVVDRHSGGHLEIAVVAVEFVVVLGPALVASNGTVVICVINCCLDEDSVVSTNLSGKKAELSVQFDPSSSGVRADERTAADDNSTVAVPFRLVEIALAAKERVLILQDAVPNVLLGDEAVVSNVGRKGKDEVVLDLAVEPIAIEPEAGRGVTVEDRRLAGRLDPVVHVLPGHTPHPHGGDLRIVMLDVGIGIDHAARTADDVDLAELLVGTRHH